MESLGDDPIVACIASHHRVAKKRKISLLDLQDGPLLWFACRLNPHYYDHCQAIFHQVGFSPRRVPEPADHHVLLGLVAEGQGCALVPRSLATIKRKDVVYKAIAEYGRFAAHVGLAYRRETSAGLVLGLVAMLKERFDHGARSAQEKIRHPIDPAPFAHVPAPKSGHGYL